MTSASKWKPKRETKTHKKWDLGLSNVKMYSFNLNAELLN